MRQRGQLEEHREARRHRTDRSVERVAGRDLAVAEGHDEEGGEGADASPDHHEGVERRLVCPVHVLEHEHGRAGRKLELLHEQGLDLVRRGAGGERARELGRDAASEVPERAERPRDREVVAAADEYPGARLETVEEPPDERRLPDARLAGDEHDAPLTPFGAGVCRGERGERIPPFE